MSLPPIAIHGLLRGMHIVTAARYLSVIGLVALLYDHALTIGDEIRLIWAAPRSFLKWIFLINHYLAEVCLILIANEMSGFSGLSYDDIKLMTTVFAYGIFSTLVANLLGYSRVIVLWNKLPRVVLVLSIALTVSFLASVGSTIATVIILTPTIEYNPIFQLCYLPKTTPMIVAVWVAPLSFEIIVLSFSAYSALSLPRDHNTPLVRVIYGEGMLFFVIVALNRGLNIAFVFVTEPGLVLLPTLFSWATVTLATHRLLIHIRSAEKDASITNESFDVVSLPTSAHCHRSTRSSSAIELHYCRAN